MAGELKTYTRGSGLLEPFLSKQRAKKADGFISDKLRKGKILDVGCGSFPYFLASIVFADKYGIDPVVSEIKLKTINLQRLNVSENKIPFKPSYFDVVTMLAVFEHIDGSDLSRVLKDIYRVLKKNGLFIITTPSPWADSLLHLMARFGLISSEEIHEHKHNHSKNRIEDFLSQAGFERKKMKSGFFEVGFNMWFVAKK